MHFPLIICKKKLGVKDICPFFGQYDFFLVGKPEGTTGPFSGGVATLLFPLLAARLNQWGELRAIIDYAPVTLLSQDSEYRPDPHPDLYLFLAGYDLAGDLGPLIQLDYSQIIGGEPLEVIGGIVDGGVGDDGPRSLEGMTLQVSTSAAVGAEVSGRKEVFVASIAVRSQEIVSLRYASPESGSLGRHLYLVNIWTKAVPPDPPTL